MAIFGKNIKTIRKQKNITQQQLADKTGISREQISKYENGSVYNIRANTTKLLCDALGCTEEELLGYEDGAARVEIALADLQNMTFTDGVEWLDSNNNQYPVSPVITGQYKNGKVLELDSHNNESEIIDGSFAYFYKEKSNYKYNAHICLIRINSKYLVCKLYVLDDSVVLERKDGKQLMPIDSVEIIGRCV